MDILAHTLWAAAAAKGVNKSTLFGKISPLNVGWTAFWGVIPDFFSFTIPFVMVYGDAILNRSFKYVTGMRRPETFTPPPDQVWAWDLAENLYKLSHSLIIFGVVFAIVWLIRGMPYWEMSAWGLHILIDIPTHSKDFFPTPFLWPLSDFQISGIPWSRPWFMIVNYGALVLVYLFLFVYNRGNGLPH